MSPECARVLAQLERQPVSQVDFLAPDVIDGLKPITRLAARIRDLKDELGEDAIVDTGQRRNHCKIYALAHGARLPKGRRRASLHCPNGHDWQGSVLMDSQGYPRSITATPACPQCSELASIVLAALDFAAPMRAAA